MFQNNLIAGASGQGGFYPYQIEQSLRFNDNDSAYLSRTPASAGNRKTWTWSGWVKRGNLGISAALFSAGATTGTLLYFRSDNALEWYDGSTRLRTSRVFRDTSSWYHVVLVVDTTNATSTDRWRLYVNGVRETAFSTTSYPALNYDTFWNNNIEHWIGNYFAVPTLYFDGYMAEVNFIDGTALDPTSFGEFKSGIWVPKAYSGAYGTNGFYLSFADSAAIGDDLSGNGNDWTANNLVSTDVLLDSPTNNYCTMNSVDNVVTLSDGNLRALGGSGSAFNSRGTFWFDISDAEGWYWEFTSVGGSGSEGSVGVAPSTYLITNTVSATLTSQTKVYSPSGNKNYSTAYGATWTTNDVIGVAVKNGKIWYAKNGVWQASGDPETEANPADTGLTGFYAPFMYSATSGVGGVFNFGQSAFAYTPPTGFLALNTANLPDPVIDPAQDDVPADYFNTVLYTGTGATQSITGVGFQPDWIWFKRRDVAASHALNDAVRGVAKSLTSNGTDAEYTSTSGNDLVSFDSDGFTVGPTEVWNSYNVSGGSLVAWNWKANGAGVSNTDGSITSTVSVNQKAGFSVVSFVNASSTNQETVGHGLSAAPKLIISKNRDTSANNWAVFHSSVCDTTSKFLKLNTTDAVATFSTVWGAALPTSSVFGVTGGGIAAASVNVIAYCFAEVEGYSKFGSYTGNGSTDGPFVYCGFRPAWVMVKRSSSGGGTANWVILDTKRDVYNLGGISLMPNLSNAEYTPASSGYPMDILSNGFKQRGASVSQNESGSTYIFMAFSEAPFKYSNAR